MLLQQPLALPQLSVHPLPEAPFQSLSKRLRGFSVGAHQGQIYGSGWMNSLAAFEEAYQDGADIIEFDLRLTKDSIPIVYHDEDLKTWTNCRGNVRDYTAEEIQRNCHFKFSDKTLPRNDHPPLFAEVLAWANGKIILNGEFKDAEVVEPSIALVQQYQAHHWVYFQTKSSPQRYLRARRFDPNVVLLYHLKSPEELNWVLAQRDPALLIIEIQKESRNKTLIEILHRHGKLVSENAWEFNSNYEFFGASCEDVFHLGIDIAITNRPADCVQQRDQLKKVYPYF